jgi:hypothetical protein
MIEQITCAVFVEADVELLKRNEIQVRPNPIFHAHERLLLVAWHT